MPETLCNLCVGFKESLLARTSETESVSDGYTSCFHLRAIRIADAFCTDCQPLHYIYRDFRVESINVVEIMLVSLQKILTQKYELDA